MAERPSVDFFVCSLWEGSSRVAGQELLSREGAPCFQRDGGTIQALASGGWGGDDGDGRGQEVSLLLPVEAWGRSAYWPLVEKSGLSRPGPAGKGELSTERVSQG